MKKFHIKSLLKQARRLVKKNASTGLTAVAVVGVFATAYFVAKETPQAQKNMEKHKDSNKAEKFGVFVGSYSKSLAAGGLTIGCIVGSHCLDRKEIAGLSALVASQMTRNQSLNKAIKALPEEEQAEINKNYIHNNVTYAYQTGHGNVLCEESLTGHRFYASEEWVRSEIGKLNFQALEHKDDSIPVNDLLEVLGLPHDTIFGDWHGFLVNINDGVAIDPHFDTGKTEDGIPYLIVKYFNDPVAI